MASETKSDTNRLGITPGESESAIESNGSRYVRLKDNLAALARFNANMNTDDNARLYADAHNTALRTGKLPSELEKDAIELRELLVHCRTYVPKGVQLHEDVTIALANAKDKP